MSRRPPLRFAEGAITEADAAARWYEERSLQAREDFLHELRQAFELIEEAPERWPQHLHGTRHHVLQRFPFSVVYRIGKRVLRFSRSRITVASRVIGAAA